MLLGNILNSIKDNLDLIASIIVSGGVIAGFALKVGKGILDKSLKPFKEQINKMEKDRKDQHNETLQKIDEVEKERFYEVYKDYRGLGGNSYIQHKVDKLQKEGKL